MKPGLALSLTISVLLIGVASWYRFGTVKVSQPNLVAVELTEGDYEEIVEDFTGPKEVSPIATSTKPLTSTDLVGRQLISDYVSLAGSGQVTDADILALADRYVEGLPTLSSAPTISYTDLKLVSDNKNNFQNYADTLTKIFNEYQASTNKIQINESDLETLSPAFYSSVATLSTAYASATFKLKIVAVPSSLGPSHLELVNIYLSTVAATNAISKTEQDSTAAFAALIHLNKDLERRTALLEEIAQIL